MSVDRKTARRKTGSKNRLEITVRTLIITAFAAAIAAFANNHAGLSETVAVGLAAFVVLDRHIRQS